MRSHSTKAPRILLYYSIISFWKDLIELHFSYTKRIVQHTRIIVIMIVNIVPLSFIESFYPRRAAIKVQAEGRPEQSAAENWKEILNQSKPVPPNTTRMQMLPWLFIVVVVQLCLHSPASASIDGDIDAAFGGPGQYSVHVLLPHASKFKAENNVMYPCVKDSLSTRCCAIAHR